MADLDDVEETLIPAGVLGPPGMFDVWYPSHAMAEYAAIATADFVGVVEALGQQYLLYTAVFRLVMPA